MGGASERLLLLGPARCGEVVIGSTAQRCGAYGGEYLQAGLRLRARGGRRIGKGTSQTRATKHYKEQRPRRLKQFLVLGQTILCAGLLDLFYRHIARGMTWRTRKDSET
jgi:hypothetical protein